MNHAFTNHVQAQTEIYLIKGVHKINKSKIEHIYDKKNRFLRKICFYMFILDVLKPLVFSVELITCPITVWWTTTPPAV